MLPPAEDLEDRKLLYDFLQTFWMDTDPAILFDRIVHQCASSKYTIAELERIFWNEVEPAVGFNLWSIAGEWAGFEVDWLAARVLEKSRFGEPLPVKWVRPHANFWWRRLRAAVMEKREDNENTGAKSN